jgi:hypothetical protein
VFEVVKNKLHGPLESGSSILKAKRHFSIRECTPRTNKICFMLVLGLDLNLIVPKKTVHERKYLTTRTCIDDLVNKWGWKIVFQETFVQVVKVHTYMDCTLLLVDKNRFRCPFHQLHKVDETILDEFLYFSLYRHYFARVYRAKLLSNRINIKISCDLLFNNTWINSWHILIRPSKDVVKLFKQFSVDLNLFRRTIHSDEDIFHDAMGSGDVDGNHFRNTFHVSLNIYFEG